LTMNYRLLSVLFCVLLVAPSFQYGILRVEEIWSNVDTLEVQIEEMIIKESDLFIDFIEDLSGNGVTVEDVIFSDGSITVPRDFTTCCGIEFVSSLTANRGIFADAGEGSNGFSFTIQDETGDVFIRDELRAQGGINVSDRFFVNGITGDTRIEEGTLRPNGGVAVMVDQFLVDPATGAVNSAGDVQVALDVFFGESSGTSTRVINRFPADGPTGGATFLIGQDSASRGGDLILEPGDGATPGNIFLGTNRNSDLFFGRNALSNGDNGGFTSFSGQTSLTSNGGDLIFNGGNSNAAGFGGEIILSPGLSTLDGRSGRMILGSPDVARAGHEVTVGRPSIPSGTGGRTTYAGQTTAEGTGGSFYLRAGSVNGGLGRPGDLYLSPGVAQSTRFSVVLGKNSATRLNLRRVATATSGGSTRLTGQDGNSGGGGDLFVRAGAADDAENGGDLYLVPGTSQYAESGSIVLGVPSESLMIRRPSVTGAAGKTTIKGQDGVDGAGGDLLLSGAAGITQGGDVHLIGGRGATSFGGDVDIFGGAGSEQGGDIVFQAGHGLRRNGGDISIGANGGDLTVSARGDDPNGDGRIVVGPAVNRFYADEIPVVIRNADVIIRGGRDTVTISTDPDALISWNGAPILKQTQLIDSPQAATRPTQATLSASVVGMSRDFDAILQALNQCGHGLINSVSQPDNVLQRCPIPTPPIDNDTTVATTVATTFVLTTDPIQVG